MNSLHEHILVVEDDAQIRNFICFTLEAEGYVCHTAATAEELETTAVSAGFDDGDLRMMADDSPDIEVRYFLLELISRLRDILRG